MRIIIHDYSGHPFQVQLSRSLAKRNHEVLHLYSGSFQTPHGNVSKLASDPDNFDCNSICLSEPFAKYSFVKRRYQEKEYGKLLISEVEKFEPDIVLSSNTPLDPQDILQKHCRQQNIKFIFWLQDLYGIAIKKILCKKIKLLGNFIGEYYCRKELNLFRKSNAVIAITEDFVPLLIQKNITSNNIYVINNWAPLEEVPVHTKDNPWSRDFNLHDRFCILYSGTLGMKHNPQLLLDLAVKLNKNNDVSVVVISEGLGADFLKQKKEELDLNNLMILQFQPYEQFPYVLATADILLTILEQDAGVFCVPSKVLTYHCAGRSLVSSIPPENLAACLVKKNNTGLVVSPNDTEEFTKAVETLIVDDQLRSNFAQNARKYAEDAFDIESITDKFESIFQELKFNDRGV